MPNGTEFPCPKCGGKLRFGPPPIGPIGTCYDCWGLWINTQRLRDNRQEFPVGEALHDAASKLLPSEATEPEEDLFCPDCPSGVLVQQRVSEVELEWCPLCRGIYLDKGERERLLGLPAADSLRKKIFTPRFSPGPDSPSAESVLSIGYVLEFLADILTDFVD
jgi:Zn-finger nucleic acid-binding protein